jgi:WD40 repeat protein
MQQAEIGVEEVEAQDALGAATGREVMPPLLHRGVVWSVAFSPDGKRVAAGCWSSDPCVKTWDVTGRP